MPSAAMYCTASTITCQASSCHTACNSWFLSGTAATTAGMPIRTISSTRGRRHAVDHDTPSDAMLAPPPSIYGDLLVASSTRLYRQRNRARQSSDSTREELHEELLERPRGRPGRSPRGPHESARAGRAARAARFCVPAHSCAIARIHSPCRPRPPGPTVEAIRDRALLRPHARRYRESWTRSARLLASSASTSHPVSATSTPPAWHRFLRHSVYLNRVKQWIPPPHRPAAHNSL